MEALPNQEGARALDLIDIALGVLPSMTQKIGIKHHHRPQRMLNNQKARRSGDHLS